jgi:hypothetical protein
MRAWVLIAGLVLAGSAACSRDTATDATDATEESLQKSAPEEAAANAPRSAGGFAVGAATPAAPASDAEIGTHAPLAPDGATADPLPRMIVRTGNAGLEVDSLELGLGALRRLAGSVGGYVADTRIQGGREQLREATLEIKVPADRFDDLTGGLEPLGRLEFVNVSAEDVGEEFVDLSARAANARRLEERLIDLLGTRTGRLQDVLSVERELARVREEVERIDGRLRYLKSRAALSTLSVTLHEPPPIVSGHPGRGLVAEAFRQAWRNFAEVLAASIASLGYLVPAAAALWGAILLGRRFKRQPA